MSRRNIFYIHTHVNNRPLRISVTLEIMCDQLSISPNNRQSRMC